MHRMVSALPFSVGKSLPARLASLREREHSWKRLRCKSAHVLRFPASGSIYEFAGGIYGNAGDDDRRVPLAISFFQLPSAESNPDHTPRSWTHSMGQLLVLDFTMDPTQDLLVLVSPAPSSYVLGHGYASGFRLN